MATFLSLSLLTLAVRATAQETAAALPAQAPATVEVDALPRDLELEVAEARADRLAVEYFGAIESLREIEPNAWLITLDNGQVWRQVEPKAYPLRVGDRVRVYPSIWGYSFRLSVVARKGFVQVRLVR